MVKLTIRDDIKPRPISPDLWGVFFEDINYSADGGLYAELLQNRSFAYTSAKVPEWGPLTAWETTGEVSIRRDEPLSLASPDYALLTVGASVTNHGFDGIRLDQGAEYRFRVFARAAAPARLTVTLGDAAESTTAEIPIESGEWVRYEITLRARASSAVGELVLLAEGAPIAIDVVSLFPVDVFHGSENGVRRDLAEAIAALRPRFMRFPGGCVAHGSGLANMYRWPATLGELQDRVPDFNVWGYHQSFGLGYFEYFRLCEQIGAAPVPVLAAGVCCQNSEGGQHSLPEELMDDYIAEVLALVEFANGDEMTQWGARRAALGHPEPFGLRYLAIGNEDEITAEFRDRFARIFLAVREAHPEIAIIGTVGPAAFGADYEQGWQFARELQVPVVDEHSYKAPKWLFENVDRYDAYDREGPAVYLGEYGSKGNRMLNALAEAAYMTGLERNADVVHLASYAPLLAKSGHTQWTPDLIYFDNQRVMPSLNYYVQQLFSTTAGDRYVRVEVEQAPIFARPRQGFAALAVEASGFRVAFRELSLDGVTVPDVVVDTDDGRVMLPVRVGKSDYVVRARATALERTAGLEIGFSVHFGAVGSPDSWEWAFGTWLNRSLTPHYTADGARDELMPSIPFSVEIGREYDIEIRVTDAGAHIDYRLDGVLMQEYADPGTPEQRFVAACVVDSTTGRHALRIVNATGEPQVVELARATDGSLPPARVTTLAADPDAGVAFETAPAIPTRSALAAGAPVAVAAHSLTIVEWDTPAVSA